MKRDGEVRQGDGVGARIGTAAEKVKMKAGSCLLLAVALSLLAAAPVRGGEPASPDLSTKEKHFFDTDRFLTSGGIRYEGTSNLTLEPELGLGYRAQERDLPGGVAQDIHNVHAQAGWRLSLAQTLHLSAAAKLPVFTYESTGHSLGQDPTLRSSYDFGHLYRSGLSWTGEFGLRLSPDADLTLYYDQGHAAGSLPGVIPEDRIGTRLILKFK